MELILSTIYLIIFGALLLRIPLVRDSGLSAPLLMLLFGSKVFAGIIYGSIHTLAFGADTWGYFKYGELVFKSLGDRPQDFLYMVFLPLDYPAPAHLAETAEHISTWKDPSAYFLVRLQALIRIFSFGYYSIHVIVWNFLSMIGLVALYRFMTIQFPSRNGLLLLFLFFLPGLTFWMSGVHKEGFCLFLLGLFCWKMYQLKEGKAVVSSLIFLILAGLFLVFVRSYLLILLLPAALCYLLFRNSEQFTAAKFAVTYLVLAALGLLLIPALGGVNILEYMVVTQHNFVKHYFGNSDFSMPLLEATVSSFANASPAALMNTFFRPFPQDVSNWRLLLAFIDNGLFWFFTGGLLLGTRKEYLKNAAVWCFCFFFAMSLFLLIGLMVDNSGAIVRYRVLAHLFFISFAWSISKGFQMPFQESLESFAYKKDE